MPSRPEKKLTFLKKRVDFLAVCDILFSVMRDMISCEEVFEADPRARAEFDAVCDEWLNESILAQDEEDTVDCTGCGEVWYRSAFPYAQGDTVDWCRKCYKSDPYFC